MTIQERIFAQLSKNSKNKLSKQKKVDLAGVQDLEIRTNGAESDFKVFDDMLADWVSRYIDLQNEVSGLINMADIYSNSILDLEYSLDEFGKSAEDLGINPFQFDEYTNATATVGSYQSNLDLNNEVLEVAKSMKQL